MIHRKKRTWSIICLILALQAHVYIFFERSHGYFDLNSINMDGILAISDRLNRFLGNILIQTFLILKLEPTASTLFRKLVCIDSKLKQPDLSRLTPFSVVGVICTFLAVNQSSTVFDWLEKELEKRFLTQGNSVAICAMRWELMEQKTRPIYWLNCVDQFIRVEV